MKLIKKLLSSTENNFGDKTQGQKLDWVRKDVEEKIARKNPNMKGFDQRK